ncbi:MAG: CbiX/SirB N-terminal domain-containing protein [Sulfurovum sp.]|nr:CbiX/SirB N-terminal domain-containing protein [Sulfurovum sp.]
MTKNALILIAHGSRKESSNSEVQNLMLKVEELTKEKYQITQAAFLEFAEPSLDKAIELCIEKGATSIVILPYFLASGNHVSKDIPSLVKEMQNRNPDVNIRVTSHLGSTEGIASLLCTMALKA